MSYGKLTECSVISCNTYYKKEIDAETLVGILSGNISPEDWKPHLDRFFNELPHKYILGVMEENGLNLQQLTKVFETLPEAFQDPHFKELIQQHD